ncbi:MAG: hypothetical protein IJG60_05995 [Thermoguttaceae bacterium]|nr:hypothetical protein [Thermoguttaceae bacterium]
MNFYYHKGDEKIGPVDSVELDNLAWWGDVTPYTTLEVAESDLSAAAPRFRKPFQAAELPNLKFGPKHYLSLKTWRKIVQVVNLVKVLGTLITLALCVSVFFHLDEEDAWEYAARVIFAGVFCLFVGLLAAIYKLGRIPQKVESVSLKNPTLE